MLFIELIRGDGTVRIGKSNGEYHNIVVWVIKLGIVTLIIEIIFYYN